MKLTLVVDTEDPKGIADSFKIIKHFHAQNVGVPLSAQVKFTKIPFIKLLRSFAKAAKEAEKGGEDSDSLRFCKVFAEKEFAKHDDGLRR